MIVVEEKLAELFNKLPEFGGKKPKYHFGDAKEANEFIKKWNNDTFPLIYQTSVQETQDVKANTVTLNFEGFIAVQARPELLNTERWATSYKDILMPLLINIQTLFTKSGIIVSEFNWDITKLPHYGETESKDKNALITIVDAIRFRLPMTIEGGKCITKTIKF